MKSCSHCKTGKLSYNADLGGSWTCVNCARVTWEQKPYITTCKRCKKEFIDGTAFMTCGPCRTRHLNRRTEAGHFAAKAGT